MNNPFFNKYYDCRSKNVGPFLAFGDTWFEKYQPYLLFLLNVPVLRLWFRWILRIHNDCKYSDVIIEIQPNNYKILLKNGELKGDFRTHPKFSKRIYFAFRWWWWLLHYFDEAFKPFPELQFGFDTLTAYPDPDPETSTVDGMVSIINANTTWTNILTLSGNAAYPSHAIRYMARAGSTSTINQYSTICRGIYLFAVNIGSESSISSAAFSWYNDFISNGLGNYTINCVTSSPSSNTNLISNDFTSFGSTSLGTKDLSDITAGYSSIALNINGLNIISKTGITKLGTVSNWDLGSGTPTWVNSRGSYEYTYFSDQTGTSNDPKFVITYSISSIKKLCGVDYNSIKSASGVAKASIKKIIGVS